VSIALNSPAAHAEKEEAEQLLCPVGACLHGALQSPNGLDSSMQTGPRLQAKWSKAPKIFFVAPRIVKIRFERVLRSSGA
jgi:hypothetical protein